ncbi:hypothetical protein N7466_006051 [Penicillium verhagenii]|uniref:uncharacterized protein n=1 Tax=Penicillium verhagenii TaxID=1562060 RepID=UPI002545B700|nr:uncharacterized protein N7466_006051 [Penicillium verhagenii]KAJ5930558.1 hypothetical protein N7466_006051 [Penicillium verhagenii]
MTSFPITFLKFMKLRHPLRMARFRCRLRQDRKGKPHPLFEHVQDIQAQTSDAQGIQVSTQNGLTGSAAKGLLPQWNKKKKNKNRNIQQSGFACGHPPYY